MKSCFCVQVASSPQKTYFGLIFDIQYKLQKWYFSTVPTSLFAFSLCCSFISLMSYKLRGGTRKMGAALKYMTANKHLLNWKYKRAAKHLEEPPAAFYKYVNLFHHKGKTCLQFHAKPLSYIQFAMTCNSTTNSAFLRGYDLIGSTWNVNSNTFSDFTHFFSFFFFFSKKCYKDITWMKK